MWLRWKRSASGPSTTEKYRHAPLWISRRKPRVVAYGLIQPASTGIRRPSARIKPETSRALAVACSEMRVPGWLLRLRQAKLPKVSMDWTSVPKCRRAAGCTTSRVHRWNPAIIGQVRGTGLASGMGARVMRAASVRPQPGPSRVSARRITESPLARSSRAWHSRASLFSCLSWSPIRAPAGAFRSGGGNRTGGRCTGAGRPPHAASSSARHDASNMVTMVDGTRTGEIVAAGAMPYTIAWYRGGTRPWHIRTGARR